ncbi:anion permease [Nonomuraea sp. CA-218870]|uniref:inorganic phosphate transporter n=1 Tax=Nonomuraea sp. CA-218870 TaxID=3239998 RepID=UPI003D8F6470
MPVDAVVLVVIAGLFAIVSGMNDGGALLATGLKLPSVRPVTGILAMIVVIALVPLATHEVALTLVNRLATFEGPGGRAATAIAVLSALAVVTVLTWKGRPTSLTLALVGGLTGAGLGWGLPVSGPYVALVLGFGLAAPIVGGLVAWGVTALLVRVSDARQLSGWHRLGFLLQILAYAANDGQKMLAIFMIAVGFSDAPPRYTILVAVLFGLGAMYGLPKAGRTLSREIIAFRPLHGVAAELSAGTAVLGCSAVGMPVSMTQAVAGGLIGAGLVRGSGRVRWYAAVKIVVAWVLTLPASGLLAAAAAYVGKGVVG